MQISDEHLNDYGDKNSDQHLSGYHLILKNIVGSLMSISSNLTDWISSFWKEFWKVFVWPKFFQQSNFYYSILADFGVFLKLQWEFLSIV